MRGCPGSPPTAPQAWRQALSLLPEPVRASSRTTGQLSKGESSLPQREGPRPLPERWAEALRPTEDSNQQPRLSLQPQSRDRLALRLLPGRGLERSCAHLLAGARHLEAGAEVVQPLPLLVPPQALQVLPQHLDDLKPEGGLRVCRQAQSSLRLLPRGALAQVSAGVHMNYEVTAQGCGLSRAGRSPASPPTARPPGIGNGLPAGC